MNNAAFKKKAEEIALKMEKEDLGKELYHTIVGQDQNPGNSG